MITKSLNIIDKISAQKCGRSALALWEEIKRCADEDGRARVDRWEIALRYKVSTRTIKNWSRALERAGAVKFKFSGVFMINPAVYFTGTDFETAKKKYAEFKGD